MDKNTVARTRPFNYPLSQGLYRGIALPAVLPEQLSFVTVLAHEVRNPLTNINLAVEMLKGLANSEEQKLYLEIISRASLRVDGLINELVRSEHPALAEIEKYSINRLIDEALLMAADRLQLKHIVIYKKYTLQDYTGKVNNQQLKIALTNIIINAIDAMKNENGQLKLVTRSVDGQYTVEIEDNGCGISAENLDHIFTPYFTTKAAGLGIGLAATYDILKENKVTIRIVSEEGKGTKFILSFLKTSFSFPAMGEVRGNDLQIFEKLKIAVTA